MGTADVRECRGPRVTPVLRLEGVGKTYRRGDEQVHVLVDFDFTLDAGEFVVVTGPSGAGKSTLLHIAGGVGAPGRGPVGVKGPGVWAVSTWARPGFRGRHLGVGVRFLYVVAVLAARGGGSWP